MKEKQLEVFKSDNLWASIFKMVIPALIAIIVMLIYNMADMIFVGQTGVTAQVAAVSVVGPIFNMIMAIAMLLSGGGTVLIAKDIGADDKEHARMVAAVCMWSAIIFGIVLGLLIILCHGPLLKFLGATDDMQDYALSYMVILACGSPFLMINNMLGQLLRAEGAMKEGLIGNLLGTFVNIALDPIFILALNMGVTGAAIATDIGNICATVFYALYIGKKAVVLNMDWKLASKNFSYVISVMALGLPTAVSTLLSGFAGSFSNQLLSGYGSDYIAANAAAGRVNLIIVMVLMGIGIGAQPLISYNYGAKDLKKMKGILKRELILTVLVGVATTVLVIGFRSQVIGLFLKDQSVAEIAKTVVTIVTISSPFLGIFYISTNYLQATGNAMGATIMSTLQKGLVLIPMLFLMNHLMGFYGIPWAGVIADFLSVIISVIFFVISFRKTSKELSSVV